MTLETLYNNIQNKEGISPFDFEASQSYVISLMKETIGKLAYRFSSNSTIDYCDFVSEGMTAVVLKMWEYDVSKGAHIKTFLTNYVRDAMQILYANMCCPVKYSVTVFRKVVKGGEMLPTKVSLNCTQSENCEAESGSFLSTEELTPYQKYVKDEGFNEIRKIIVEGLGERGEEAFNLLMRYARKGATNYNNKEKYLLKKVFKFASGVKRIREILLEMINVEEESF